MLASSPLVPVIIRNVVRATQSEQHQKKGRETVQRLNNFGEQMAASLVLISRNTCKAIPRSSKRIQGIVTPRNVSQKMRPADVFSGRFTL
jgi:hypothetical protein